MEFKRINTSIKEEINDFLNLPKMLYPKNKITQDRKTELELLLGNHILSKYSHVEAYLLYENNKAVCRAILTFLDSSNICYIGLFECIDNLDCSKYFLKNIELVAKAKGIKEIVGPIDASFWLKYRMKINNFEDSYTGEPTNKEYYYKLFKESGYEIKFSYTSNFIDYPMDDNLDDKISDIERRISNLGREYIIENLCNKDKNKVLIYLYYLFSDLYSSFPVYSAITKDDFINMFKNMFKVVNDEFVLLAYNNKGKMVGFSISLPDYKDLLYKKITLFSLLRILRIKKNPKRIVNLYIGAYKQDSGLGKLLTYKLAKIVQKKDIKAIGALIMNGKVTNNYFKSFIVNQTNYVLLNKFLI